MKEFNERVIEVVGVSIDSQFTHHAWRNKPIKEGGIGPVLRSPRKPMGAHPLPQGLLPLLWKQLQLGTARHPCHN